MDAKNEYLLLFRGKEWWGSLTPEELQKTMDQVKGWFERLGESGKLKAAQPLVRAGAIISGKTRSVIADGPYAESKEVIAGYAIFEVGSKSEILELTKRFLAIMGKGESEVRLMPDRPAYQRA